MTQICQISSSQMLDLYYHLYDEDSQQAMMALANSCVVDGCFGSQYSLRLRAMGQVKNRENSASSPNARACKHTVFDNGKGGIRTRGRDMPYTAFPRLLLKPLGHLSGLIDY